MDDRAQKALDFANYRSTLAAQRETLRFKLTETLIYAINGGTFTVTRELCTFTDLLIRHGNTETVMIDDKGNPILIADLPKFLSDILGVYQEASNAYRFGWDKLRSARSVKALVE